MKATPGPWFVGGFYSGRGPYGVYPINGDGPKWIGDAVIRDTREEAEANARLIAAAPDLLETLKDIEANLTGKDYMEERIADSIRRIKQAIFKAERGNHEPD